MELFGETLWEVMKYTDIIGEKKFGSRWQKLDKTTMLQFHACLLRMANIDRQNMKHYFWKADGDSIVKSLGLSREAYGMIYSSFRLYSAGTVNKIQKVVYCHTKVIRYVCDVISESASRHGASNETKKELYDPLYKCRPALTTTLLNFQRCRNPGMHLSLDESMAKTRVKYLVKIFSKLWDL